METPFPGRPIEIAGQYGLQNGTSYDNSWNGLTSMTNIAPGDTIYVCDTHVFNATSLNYPSQQAVFRLTNNIVLRGDYPDHPGIISGIATGVHTYGYRACIGTNSNITFLNLNTEGFYINLDTNWGIYRTSLIGGGPTNITWDNCVLTNYASTFLPLYCGWDNWKILNCTITHCANGIYAVGSDGPIYGLIVSNCTFANIGIEGYEDNDAHALGLQNISNCKITWNTITNTGAAIEFYNGPSIDMTNNEISYNFIKDISVMPVTGGGGIVISGENSAPGSRTGYVIHHNIINNTGLTGAESWHGDGINCNSSDGFTAYNNVILNTRTGINIGINGAYSYNANIHHNIIHATNRVVQVSGNTVGTFTCDYNLFYGQTNVSFSPDTTHDSNSYYADPLFLNASTNSTSRNDFKLLVASPIYSLTGTNNIGYWDMGAVFPPFRNRFRGVNQ